MQQPQLSSLYQQLILEHYRNPRNKAELPERTVEVHMANPVCGDEIRLQLLVEGDRIAAAKFVGQGCSISQASVSMMTTLLEGRDLSEADALAERFTRMMHGEEEAARDRALGDLRALQGVSKFPVRIKCALLGFDALREALRRSGAESGPEAKEEGPGGRDTGDGSGEAEAGDGEGRRGSGGGGPTGGASDGSGGGEAAH